MDTLQIAQYEERAPWTDISFETTEFVAFNDGYAVTEGHLLLVPKNNNQEHLAKCFASAMSIGNLNVAAETNNVTGFNIGMNVGTSAGQTCMYPHVHLIFRRDGDTTDPTGGVRNVIPGKGNYK